MAKKMKKVKVTPPQISSVCVAGNTTKLHLVYPMAKIMNRLGSVQLITEDPAWLSLSHKASAEFLMGNLRVRYVEMIALMEEEELELENFDYNILDVNLYVPEVKVDKYLITSGREIIVPGFSNAKQKNTPIITLYDQTKLTKMEVDVLKETLLANEDLYNFKTVPFFADYLAVLMEGRTEKVKFPPKVQDFITSFLEFHNNLKKADLRFILNEKGFTEDDNLI